MTRYKFLQKSQGKPIFKINELFALASHQALACTLRVNLENKFSISNLGAFMAKIIYIADVYNISLFYNMNLKYALRFAAV